MMDIARIVVAVCDSSKFGRRSLSLIAPLSAVHRMITDRRAPKSDIARLRKAGVVVTQVYGGWQEPSQDSRKLPAYKGHRQPPSFCIPAQQ
jgi:DeoR/GlpR family transcriptional regulator of sugar metabolism